MKGLKLASAGTLEGIAECISKFYVTKCEILEDGSIKRLSDGFIMTSTHVIKKKNRYIFEGK